MFNRSAIQLNVMVCGDDAALVIPDEGGEIVGWILDRRLPSDSHLTTKPCFQGTAHPPQLCQEGDQPLSSVVLSVEKKLCKAFRGNRVRYK